MDDGVRNAWTSADERRGDVVNPAHLGDDARVAFWERQAQRLDWVQPWHTAHRFEPAVRRPGHAGENGAGEDGADTDDDDGVYAPPVIEWFAGGKLNVAYNCVDRHVEAGRGSHVALHFEGEPGDRLTYTYADLQREVSRAANALEALGVVAGDRVVIYLPVIPETVIITLACARIGAVHSLVFGGFSAEALRFRVEDTGAKVLVTSDGQHRRGAVVPVKRNADAAVGAGARGGANAVEHVVVVRRTAKPGAAGGRPGAVPVGARGARSTAESAVPWTEGRDVWWHELLATVPDTHEPAAFDAESPLFLMYTSGTTGRPKGLVHTMGGYLVQTAYTHALLFDLLPDASGGGGVAGRVDELSTAVDPARRDATVHWCTADLAWVTAHTYEIYGPLVNGVTQVIYEGTPNTPHFGRHLEIIERYGVTTYYTAPTLVRSLMGAFPDGVPATYNLDSVRLIGTVGEAINPEAWRWFRQHIGGGAASVIDTWWQSETGATILSPRPHDAAFDREDTEAGGPKPGCATRALPGVNASVVDADGVRTPPGVPGFVVVDAIGPSIARTVWKDPQRYADSYWRQYADRGWFFAGDGGRYDEDGDIWILGRVDDVINVSGHRLSTIEIESALVTHPDVVEAGCCPVGDPLTGHAVAAFVVLRAGSSVSAEDLRAHVGTVIGPIARPKVLIPVPDLPKTRSGKIMRRLLTQLWEGSTLGDITSLQDETSVEGIARAVASERGR
ncbi:acetyl-coenzyme A synthetase [Tersicoccus phoenicis]|uniref:acetate--CoA ligase n=1 Tax=Tersicoccus phoenicis TaxID=554083 RepID=A0A1R1L836_9MICC|nr:AMP-binding protein [Tersicoccus phoenicis]OMH23683.1 acetyl-coenzyme A synthetase [Tersicoccus phoenicis]